MIGQPHNVLEKQRSQKFGLAVTLNRSFLGEERTLDDETDQVFEPIAIGS